MCELILDFRKRGQGVKVLTLAGANVLYADCVFDILYSCHGFLTEV